MRRLSGSDQADICKSSPASLALRGSPARVDVAFTNLEAPSRLREELLPRILRSARPRCSMSQAMASHISLANNHRSISDRGTVRERTRYASASSRTPARAQTPAVGRGPGFSKTARAASRWCDGAYSRALVPETWAAPGRPGGISGTQRTAMNPEHRQRILTRARRGKGSQRDRVAPNHAWGGARESVGPPIARSASADRNATLGDRMARELIEPGPRFVAHGDRRSRHRDLQGPTDPAWTG